VGHSFSSVAPFVAVSEQAPVIWHVSALIWLLLLLGV
jgi:hypothetical protein